MNKLTDKEGKRELLEASQKSFNERHGTKDKDSKIVTLSKGWVDFEEHEKQNDMKKLTEEANKNLKKGLFEIPNKYKENIGSIRLEVLTNNQKKKL